MADADNSRGNKPWKLSEFETFSSYSSWRNILLYNLRKEKEYREFLTEDDPPTWAVLTSSTPKRGLDTQVKADNLNSMLRFIASYSPSFLRTDIEKNCTSLEKVWQSIRGYFRFEKSEIQFINLLSITREEGERPQRLYQRIVAHLQDNLLTTDARMQHNGEEYKKCEDMSPTVERWAVLHWMHLLHPRIPSLVKRTFATDLQRYTLKDLQPRIADAIDSFLEEIQQEDHRTDRVQTRASQIQHPRREEPEEYDEEHEDILVARAQTRTRPRYNKQKYNTPNRNYSRSGSHKQCTVCKMANKPYFHAPKDCEILHAIRSLKVLEDLTDLDIEDSE